MSYIFDIVKFVLMSVVLLWGVKHAFFAIIRSGSISARGRLVLYRMVSATAGVIFLSAFAYWIYPTPWKEWGHEGQWYRINRLTGQKQQLMECGCDWFNVEE